MSEMSEYGGAMITATKEYSWDMAHMLAGHGGLCKNVHGHTYKMQVTIFHIPPHKLEPEGPAEGMVVDFKDLKSVVQELIVNELDHGFMAWSLTKDKAELAVIKALSDNGRKVVLVDYRPTAENMAINFLHQINYQLNIIGAPYQVISVKVWETPTSFAEAML